MAEQAVALRCRGGDREGARLEVAAVDALTGDDSADLLDAVLGLPDPAPDRVAVPRQPVRARVARHSGARPAAVTPGGAVARDLPFEHNHAQGGVELLQVIRGPETGEAGADDRHIALDVPRKPGARLQRLRHPVEPQASG